MLSVMLYVVSVPKNGNRPSILRAGGVVSEVPLANVALGIRFDGFADGGCAFAPKGEPGLGKSTGSTFGPRFALERILELKFVGSQGSIVCSARLTPAVNSFTKFGLIVETRVETAPEL